MFKFLIIQVPKEKQDNNGTHQQRSIDYTLTGNARGRDSVPFDKGSDIPELKISVKAKRFTLAENLNGKTVQEQLQDYERRTASSAFIFASIDGFAYCMNKTEFMQFLKIAVKPSLEWNTKKTCQCVKGVDENNGGRLRKYLTEKNPQELTPQEALRELQKMKN